MKKTLFDIEFEYLQLMNQIEEAEGEITDEIADKLAITEEEFEHKFKQYFNVIKACEADINFISDRSKELSNKAKVKKNIISRLQEKQKEALRLFGNKTDKGGFKYDFTDLKTWIYDLDAIAVKDEEALNTHVSEELKKLLETNKTDLDLSVFTIILSVESNSLPIIQKILPILKEHKVLGKINVKYGAEEIKTAINNGKKFEHFEIRKSTVLRYK